MEYAAIEGEKPLDRPGVRVREKLGTKPTWPAVEENPGRCKLSQAKDSVGSPVSTRLAAPERRGGVGGRRHGLVHADHSRLEPTRQRSSDSPVLAPDAGSQGELAGVGRRHRPIGVGDPTHEQHRTECPGERFLGLGRLGQQHGRGVEPAVSGECGTAGQNPRTGLTAAWIIALKRSRAASVIMGPRSVSSRPGSPTLSALACAARASAHGLASPTT